LERPYIFEILIFFKYKNEKKTLFSSPGRRAGAAAARGRRAAAAGGRPPDANAGGQRALQDPYCRDRQVLAHSGSIKNGFIFPLNLI